MTREREAGSGRGAGTALRIAREEDGGTALAWAAAAAGAGMAVALLARRLAAEPTPRVDQAIMRRALRWRTTALDVALSPLVVAGLPGVYIPAAYLVARRLRAARAPAMADALIATSWGAWVGQRLLKRVAPRERPPRWGMKPKQEASFPSGHTTGAAAVCLAAAVALRRQGLLSARAAVALGVGLPATMGVSRVYWREHWASDVVGGWLLGGAVACALLAISRE